MFLDAYSVPVLLLATICLYFLYIPIRQLYSIISSPHRDVPGPLLARFTKLWYLYEVYLGRFEHLNIALHDMTDSKIVRLAPNWYSVKDPSALKVIYGIGSKFEKNDWYEGWKDPGPEKYSLFTLRDTQAHAAHRRKFQAFYAMSTLVSYEQYVDDCIAIFKQRLAEFAAQKQSIDMGHWVQCYAFDVIGDITYSKRFGFLDAGEDVGGLLESIQQNLAYSTLIGIYANIHIHYFWLLARLQVAGAGGKSFVLNFAKERLRTRVESGASEKGESDEVSEDAPMDFLDKFLRARKAKPEQWTDWNVLVGTFSNIVAGSDTTGSTISAILYYLIRNPPVLAKLRVEIEDTESRGECGRDSISFKESQAMPYLQAVFKEAMRLHPAAGLPLWRVVPAEGAMIGGHHFKGGEVIGVNSWVSHYDESVWGSDVRSFRPERWIDERDESQLKYMEQCWMPFGLGSRTCIGKNISLLEMSKLVPQLVRDFDFELDMADPEWSTVNYWFVKPANFRVKVKLQRERKV